MLNNYVILLMAGRVGGAKLSDAELADIAAKAELIKMQYPDRVLAIHGSIGGIAIRLEEEEAANVAALPYVYLVEKDKRIKSTTVIQPNAPWNLASISSSLYGRYSYTTTGKGVKVYVYDSGIDVDHVEFEGRAVMVYDATTSGGLLPVDFYKGEHGTHVAGIIASKTYGVAKEATILGVQVLEPGGTGYQLDLLDGLNWLVDNHEAGEPGVVNMSLGYYEDLEEHSELILDSYVQAVINDGVTVVAAAGNDSGPTSAFHPACMSDVLTVGAYDKDNKIAIVSNYGPEVDIFAPGVDVVSTVPFDNAKPLTGTSMAAPHVTGVIAKLLELKKDLQPAEVKLAVVNQAIVDKVIHEYGDTTKLGVNSEMHVVHAGDTLVIPNYDTRVNLVVRTVCTVDGLVVNGPWQRLPRTSYPILSQQAVRSMALFLASTVNTQVIPGQMPTVIPPALPASTLNSDGSTSTYAVDSNGYLIETVRYPDNTVQIITNSPMVLIGLTVNPEEVYGYSFDLGIASGTFSFTQAAGVPPGLKQSVDIQGLLGRVERIAVSSNRGNPGVPVEGRLMPMFSSEYIHVRALERSSTNPYRVSELIKEVGAKAGTPITFAAIDNIVPSYEFTGRFINALEELATMACGQLIQQNGQWFILRKGVSLGEYTVPEDYLISLSIDVQADILDKLIDIIKALIDAISQKLLLEDEIAAALDVLTKMLQTHKDEPGVVVAPIPLDNITFSFGIEGASSNWQPVPPNMYIDGGLWEYWVKNPTVTADKGYNAAKRSKYYQVLHDDKATVRYYATPPNFEDEKGCVSLVFASLLYKFTPPSDSAGIYWGKGKLRNLDTLGWLGDDIWSLLHPVTRYEDEVDQSGKVVQVRKTYFSFKQVPTDKMVSAEGAGISPPVVLDSQLYSCSIEVYYLPAGGSNVFIGQVDKKYNPLYDTANRIIAAVPINGGTVYASDGQILGEFDSATGTLKSDQGVVLANYTLNVITWLNNGAQLGRLGDTEYAIISNNKVFGAIDKSSFVVKNLHNIAIGRYVVDQRSGRRTSAIPDSMWDYNSGLIKNDTNIVGQLFNANQEVATICLYGNDLLPGADFLSNTAELQLQRDYIAKLKLDLEVAAAKIECLTRELERYNASYLLPMIEKAGIALYKYQRALSIQRGTILADVVPSWSEADALREAAMIAADECFEAISSLLVEEQYSDCAMLYNNTLPLPGNRLWVNGRDLGIVESVRFQASDKSCTVNMRARL